jgi:hypothetical protein
MLRWLPALAVVLGTTAVRADHTHHQPTSDANDAAIVGTFGVVAGSYESRLYRGDYQGLELAARWSRPRFSLAVGLPAYRLTKNGADTYGIGDLALSGDLTLLARGPAVVGLALAVGLPTGGARAGLGMGHMMVMSAAWVRLNAHRRFAVTGSAGYGRAIGGAGTHAEHGGGAWPLVDPMTASELIGGVGLEVALTDAFRAGVRGTGALPVPRDGNASRVTAGIVVGVTYGRFDTTAMVDAGLAGHPSTVRGMVATSLRFD